MDELEAIYNRLLMLAEHRGIIVDDIYEGAPSNRSFYIKMTLQDPTEPNYYFIYLNPKLSLENKIYSLAVNLSYAACKTSSLFLNLHNFRVLNKNGDHTEIWFEELKGIRDEWPDRFGRKLIALLRRKEIGPNFESIPCDRVLQEVR
jgi:hypothetical protein